MKISVFLFAMLVAGICANAQSKSSEYFTIENYYMVQWGHADEFLELYKKNHYPLLKKAMEKGDVISITMEKPINHQSEESRWDYRVTLVFKNIQAAFDPLLTEPYKKELYPNADQLAKDESHRFELLVAHWDVPVTFVDLNKP